MSYLWNGAEFFTSDQKLKSYRHKTDFHVFGPKTFTKKISNFKMVPTMLW